MINLYQRRGFYRRLRCTFIILYAFTLWISSDKEKYYCIKKNHNLYLQAIHSMQEKLKFAHSDNMGYVTFCPTNLGTTLRASVHIKIPKLAAAPEFKEFCEALNIQPRGGFLLSIDVSSLGFLSKMFAKICH